MNVVLIADWPLTTVRHFNCREEVTLFPDNCDEYASHFRHRYNCIYQRLQRNPLFTSKSIAGGDHGNKFKVTFELYFLRRIVRDLIEWETCWLAADTR